MNYTISNIINCGTLKADFQNNFSSTFKFTIITSLILMMAYFWLNSYIDKKYLLNKIDTERFKNIKNFISILFYIFLMLQYFIFYTLYLSGIDF